jgi:hypothetical protein
MPVSISDTASTPAPLSLLTNGERLLSPAALAKQIPSHRERARHINAATVFRWITRGVKTPGGELIKLEAIKVGSFWRTSMEAAVRFFDALTAASHAPADTPPAPPAPTPKQRSRAAAKASRAADAMFGTATS